MIIVADTSWALERSAGLDAAFRAAARPDRAQREKSYLKSDLVHHGVSVPAVRTAVRQVVKGEPDLDRARLAELAGLLWNEPAGRPEHERRLAAAVLLTERSDLIEVGDVRGWEALLRQARTWALVDVLAGDAFGPALDRLAAVGAPGITGLLDGWAADPDFWVRRSALLVHLRPLRAGGGDWDRFAGYADLMLDEREFFIRKAIGWVLRDTSRRRPDLVFDWLLPRAGRASGVTMRECVKYLSPDQVTALRPDRH